MDDDIYVLRINGSGFLKQMVRLIFGTILRYSSGSISKKDIIKSLVGNDEIHLGFISPGESLFLYEVNYPESIKVTRSIVCAPNLESIFMNKNHLWANDNIIDYSEFLQNNL